MFQTDIIEKCKQNDRKAQMQLYAQYCDGMYAVASRFVKNPVEAEDIVQEAFIKAFAKLHQYKKDVAFGAWLKRIVINKCIDLLKSKRAHLLPLDEVHLKAVDDVDGEWLVEDLITIDQVKQAISQLPETNRYVVMLYLVEGYDHQEIADILGTTESNSRTQLSRGKVKLQELLKHRYNGERP
ncbi:MAG TPA: RNA polymerase sigma factor [Aquaticitalea sp.]|nr:RNA polymerase sigma factor [Aquaticitalea sp.]